ncbi:glutamyl-tRNA reductase [Oceanisphaera pacifica]|uniref:Glutamyl-tRNA reductase n=1 Tax=Oceanisphaera pacifica TaxID=2818389 RepID=A0ABS3NE48_9GAMM|nr:glutamyl-tRNA reductase [Oceanisphaera pacifica]MBO1518856.1 glutamyl-tRNA reductase [Oceanisphaera pacifica]
MSLLVLGINHKTASVALREKVAFGPEIAPRALQELVRISGVEEAVILSTCNRTELYCHLDPNSDSRLVKTWLQDFHQLDEQELNACLYQYHGEETVRHIMRVACGLDSLVLGEPQILGQMKLAYNQSQKVGSLNGVLDRLLQKTFSVAKRVRTETEIGSSAVSVAFAAVSLAKRIFSDLGRTRVLLVGAGETIELVARHLKEQSVTDMTVANRTLERAQNLAQEFNGDVITLEQIPDYLPKADIVISSTASPLPIIGKGLVERALKARRQQPILLVDIAVPRDIEAEVDELNDAYLYTVDDLQGIIEQNMATRQQAATQAEVIIEEERDHFMAWFRSLESVKLIVDYRSQAELLQQQELALALQALAQGKDSAQVMQRLARRLTNKLIHTPTQALNQAGQNGDQDMLTVLANNLKLGQH